MWEALNASSFSQWMTVSRWAYPAFLTAHGLGMAAVVGLTVMIGARVLGWPKQVPLAAYARTIPFGLGAFFVNAVSGLALFVADAMLLVKNPSFILKLISIAIGIAVFTLLYKGAIRSAVRNAEAGLPEYRPTGSDKIIALLTILVWAAAVIVSGRLVAYFAEEF